MYTASGLHFNLWLNLIIIIIIIFTIASPCCSRTLYKNTTTYRSACIRKKTLITAPAPSVATTTNQVTVSFAFKQKHFALHCLINDEIDVRYCWNVENKETSKEHHLYALVFRSHFTSFPDNRIILQTNTNSTQM